MLNYILRSATVEDAEQILAIYAPYIRDTAITFEYDVPSVEEFRERIQNTLKKYPYIVAETDNHQILGYAYASAFHPREAYRFSAELSIYLAPAAKRQGLGRVMYENIEHTLKNMGITNLYACIGTPRTDDDPYLTWDSVHFHEKLGFRENGKFTQCGYKFNRWYDMVWMEKFIAEHDVK